MNLGAHMSIAGGVHLALQRGKSIDCNAVQLFVKSSNQWRAKKLTTEEIDLFREESESFTPGFIIAHTSYLINIASPDPDLLKKSADSLLVELQRCAVLGIPYLVLHPGSHRGAGMEQGIETIASTINSLYEQTAGDTAAILLEITAGAGNTIGSRFEELAGIIDLIEDKSRIGICYDTCHGFTAGYDIRTKRTYNATFKALDETIGFEYLKAFHLNDSMKEFGSHKDRHTHIGQGEIGIDAFSYLMRDKRFRDRAMVLETPKGPDMKEDVENLALLRSLRKAKK
ncbi:MAG: deoxyribonuclease IV [Candidatus Krumholzibacteria bacterium]|nr:deoxyribonuclease IV [Candidatus Krumholzibacteria bacterium]